MANNNTQAPSAKTNPAGLRHSIYSLVARGWSPIPLLARSKNPNLPAYAHLGQAASLTFEWVEGEAGDTSGYQVLAEDGSLLGAIIIPQRGVPYYRYNPKNPLVGEAIEDKREHDPKRWFDPDTGALGAYGEFRNLGIAIKPSGVWVLDLDSEEAWEKLKAYVLKKTGSLESLDTFMIRSGSGEGRHLIHLKGCEWTSHITQSERFLGIEKLELKGNGIEVLPPSLHKSGGLYEVLNDAPVLDAPPWLTQAVEEFVRARKKSSPSSASSGGGPSLSGDVWTPPPVPLKEKGGRNDVLASFAGSLARRGYTEEEIRPKLLERNNDPLWFSVPLSEEEIDNTIMKSVATWVRKRLEKTNMQESTNGHKDEQKVKENQTERLVRYARDSGAELFMDKLLTPHVLIGGEAVPLGSRCYPWLRRLMWEREGKTVGGEALKNAAQTLAMLAEDGEVRELHTRSAYHEGAIYYQLSKGRVVRIDREGWEMDEDPPVVFRSIPNLKDLPDPKRGGSLDSVLDLMNLKTERDKRMMRAYLVTIPLPHIGRPILEATGVMGSGKSTASRLIKRSLDPTIPETVRVDPRDFLQKASHAYIVMLDNQNSIPEWAVDIFCRLVDKEGDSKRKNYTDDEDFIYEMRRAILLNGINPPTERGDIQDRTLPIELHRIPDNKRRGEEELWEEFEETHPKTLGAIFEALSRTLRVRETIKLSTSPRLYDWGHYAAAAYQVFGWSIEEFMRDWGEVVSIQNQGTLDGSPVAQVILAFMENKDEWEGLASDLYTLLLPTARKLDLDKDPSWPQSSWLTRRIREVVPLLTAMGVSVTIPKGRKKGTSITLERTSPPCPEGGSKGGSTATGGSKDGATATGAATTDPAKAGGVEENSSNGGSRGSKSGGFSYLSLTGKNEEIIKGGEGDRTPLREVPINTASTATRGLVEELEAAYDTESGTTVWAAFDHLYPERFDWPDGRDVALNEKVKEITQTLLEEGRIEEISKNENETPVYRSTRYKVE
jgi:hypothetical protein